MSRLWNFFQNRVADLDRHPDFQNSTRPEKFDKKIEKSTSKSVKNDDFPKKWKNPVFPRLG